MHTIAEAYPIVPFVQLPQPVLAQQQTYSGICADGDAAARATLTVRHCQLRQRRCFRS